MNEINTIDSEQQILPIELSYLFAQLVPQDVEQFYQSYRLWSLQHDIAAVQGQISELQQQIEHNAQLMQSVQPSPIALSALAQLQAYGVSDLDLLDRMLERGDSWLNHTVQLLVRCEELGVIRSNYTQWCENALEGAYDWITTMDQAPPEPAASGPFDENIEITLIQKLMSEDDSAPGLPDIKADSTDIAEQATLLPANNAEYTPPAALAPSNTDTVDQLEISAETPIPDDSRDPSILPAQTSTDPSTASSQTSADTSIVLSPSSADQSTVPSPSSAGTDLSCPPGSKDSQLNPAEPDSSYGTTEAINLEDLKVPVTIQDDDLDADSSSITSDQSTEAIQTVDVPSGVHNITTDTTANATVKRRDDTIYQFRYLSANISHNSDYLEESNTTIDSSITEITSPTANHTKQAPQQENDSEEQAAIAATITATNTVTARTVKNSEGIAEQPEQTTYDPTTTQVHLQEDDLALPPVTNPYKPSISWSGEPVVSTTAEHPKQTLQATTTGHKPDISWSDGPIEPHQTPQKKPHSVLERLFRHPRNRRND